MPIYPDKRARYAGIAPWEFQPGATENPKQTNSIQAIRESTSSRLFRSTTAEIPPEPLPAPTTVVPEPVYQPTEKDIEL